MKVHKNGFIEESNDDDLGNFLFSRIKTLERKHKVFEYFLETYNSKTLHIFNLELQDYTKKHNKDMKIMKRYIDTLNKRSEADAKNLEDLNKAVVDLIRRLVELEKTRK
jgi:hypothetical protein